MFRFLFGKSSRDTPGSVALPTARPPKPVASPPRPPAEAVIPVEVRLAALAALPDSDPQVIQTALDSGPLALREAALARVSEEGQLARIACEAKSADTRYAAAVRVVDETHLQGIAEQIRTRDKRVYKLARERLDAFAQERERQALQARWVETIEALAAQIQPELSRVVEVERMWAALKPDADAAARFEEARTRIRSYFQAQAEARRRALRGAEQQTPASLPVPADQASTAGTSAPGPTSEGSSPESLDVDLAGASPDSLPPDGSGAHVSPVETVQQDMAEATSSLAEPADAHRAQPAAAAPAPAVEPVEATASKPASRPPRKPAAADPALRDEIAAELAALESALDDGRLHDAEGRLTALSALQSRAGGVAGALGGRIRGAAEEIARLRAWRRWGGQQARDHLCEAAEALPERALPPEELSRAIKALRAQWQQIASDEGGAPQQLWERFDGACERAWEPVRIHFAQQAERRAANLARREALLAELESAAAALAVAPVDWKAVALLSSDAARRWRTLGPVDRKAMRVVEQRFQTAHGALERSIRVVRDGEAAERDALIRRAEQVAAKPDARDSVTRMRELQAEWQTRARAVPLDRAREQALWERFRAVCNTLFEQRDAARAAEESERTAQVEAESRDFRQRSEAWRAVREAFLASVRVELALLADPGCAQSHAERLQSEFDAVWSALPAMDSKQAKFLRARREGVLSDLAQPETRADLKERYAAASARLAEQVLELEIALGLPSPDSVQAERRRVQLQKLADALRSGGRDALEQHGQQVLALLGAPCADGALAQRIEQILLHLVPAQARRTAAPVRSNSAPRRPSQESRARRAE